MFKLDNNFLTTLGLSSLPVDEKNKLLQHIYERLEMNVGMRLAEKMTDQQLDEFESFIDRNDEAGALRWLETNFPNYKQVVAEELEKLKTEVAQAAPQILAAAQVTANAASQPMAQNPMQPQQAMPQAPAPSEQPFGAQQPTLQQPPVAPQPNPIMQPAYPQFDQPSPQAPVDPYSQPVAPAPQPMSQPQFGAPAVPQQDSQQPSFPPQPQPAPQSDNSYEPVPQQQPQPPQQPPAGY